MHREALALGKTVRKRLWLLVPFLVILVGGAIVMSLAILPKQYRAVTTLIVQPKSLAGTWNSDDVVTNQRLTVTYGQILRSNRIAREVIANLGLDMTESAILKKLSVVSAQDSLLTAISVRDEDPTRALKIAGEFAAVFVARLPSILHVENTVILDSASLDNSGRPVSPNLLFFGGIGLFLALNAWLGIAFLLEAHDRSVETEEQMEMLLGVPVLAVVPKRSVTRLSGQKNGEQGRGREFLYSADMPRSSVAESFRTLRTNMRYMSFGQEFKVILITSPTPLDGKTSVSAELAIVMAQEQRKVVLVDCDLRCPRLHTVFGVTADKGLTQVLSGETDALKALLHSEIGNLDLLLSGNIPANPIDLLSGGHLEQAVAALRLSYDVIILDSPPLIPVADSQVLAKVADAVLLVAKYRVTPEDSVSKSKSLVERAKGNLVGSVLNAKPHGHGKYGRYYRI